MFAVRDQENLVHGHQAAAAAKPLNQGTRQLGPKTPGNKVPKTPLKIPLNDENANQGFGAGKSTLNMKTTGKNAFVTPMGSKARAPLGAKTTNAKTKAFQTPAPAINNDLAKTKKNSISAQKSKPKPKPEATKLDVLDDQEVDDVPEIEYMPPRVQNLPDLPDDHEELDNLDLSVVSGNFFEGALARIMDQKDWDGLSLLDRQEQRKKEESERRQRKHDAKVEFDLDSLPVLCFHQPECPGEHCKDTTASRKAAQEKYDRAIAIIDAEPAPKKLPQSPGKALPTTAQTKVTATALSKPNVSAKIRDPVKKVLPSAAKPRLTTTLANSQKTKPKPLSNPSPMRHNAAVANSKTTLGPAKGRAVSASLKQRLNPQESSRVGGFVPFEERDNTVSPREYWNRYGAPPLGSDMWTECWQAGYLKEGGEEQMRKKEEEERKERDDFLDKDLRESALEDFQLTLG